MFRLRAVGRTVGKVKIMQIREWNEKTTFEGHFLRFSPLQSFSNF